VVTAEVQMARTVNEEHRKLNSHLREENNLLYETLLSMYNLFCQIDFGAYDGKLKTCFGDVLEYDSVPWEKWEIIIDSLKTGTLGAEPVQLRLF